MTRASLCLVTAALACLLGSGPAPARSSFDLVRYDVACPANDREARSLRQTVLILDEAMVVPDPEASARMTRMVVEAADARESSGTLNTLGTRERFTILVARRDGSEMVPLFTGCAPNLPPEEVAQRKSQDGTLDRFLWGGTENKLQKARTDYVTAVSRALAQLRKQAAEIAAEPLRPGTVVTALRNAGRLADAELGLPRFILVSPFSIVDPATFRDVSAARRAGFDLAERSGVDFGRAEVYLAGAAIGTGLGLEAARAFVLGSRGSLVATRSDALPRFAPEPVSVAVFSGFLDNVGLRMPMQMRFALSGTGELVNSWVETTIAKPVATPLEGKAICRAGGACELLSRDRFARVWLLDPQAEPADRSDYPFGSARNVDVKIAGAAATGSVWDAKMVFRLPDGAGSVERLRFDLQRIDGGRF